MAITAGQEFPLPSPSGSPVLMRVTAVRHHPVSFAEVQPVAGGDRFSMPLRLVEHATRSSSTVR